MRITFLLTLWLIIINSKVISQGRTNLFQGGYSNYAMTLPFGGNKVDFITGLAIVGQEFRAIDYDFTGTNITDSLGNLLFATNGVIIMNNANDTMFNGTGLNPSQYTNNFSSGLRLVQPNIILPDLSNPDRYYLFHMTFDVSGSNAHANYFYYSLIDMSLNGGTGQVIQKNQILLNGNFSGNRLTACKHANGRDWWIILVPSYDATYNIILLTPNGPYFNHSQTFNFTTGYGQSVFSSDGTRYGSYGTDDDFELWDFDRCSGMLSNYRHIIINDSMISSGAAFSPDSRYLYGSSAKYLYQIDASSNQPDTTLTTVAVWDGTYSPNPPFSTLFYMQQLANDGKIYITTGNSTDKLHVIDAPDSSGINCNVLQHAVALPTFNVTVPNHPNYFLGALTGSPCDTLGVGLGAPEEVSLKIQPNPISGHFQIIYPPQAETGAIEVFDVMGKRVYSGNIPPWSQLRNMDLTHFTGGIYLVKMYWKNRSGVVKLIKE